jgi:hypothetical protein
MRRKKKNESIWHYMMLNGEFKMPRVKFWYEVFPGFAFKAVWFGRQRNLFGYKQYFVLCRNNLKNECFVEWVLASKICQRDTWGDKFHDSGLLSSKKNEALRNDGYINTNIL